MTKAELNKFRTILESRQTELEGLLRDKESIRIEKSPDPLDEVQSAADRGLAIHNLDHETQLLKNVRAALKNLDAGNFGICVECDDEIGEKRLAAVPSAQYCIRCQEAVDKRLHSGDESVRFALAV